MLDRPFIVLQEQHRSHEAIGTPLDLVLCSCGFAATSPALICFAGKRGKAMFHRGRRKFTANTFNARYGGGKLYGAAHVGLNVAYFN